jgi:two-component system phosphate regulon sensor histidine kinase PhoR
MMIIAVVAIIAAISLCVIAFRGAFQAQIWEDLQTTSEILLSTDAAMDYVEQDYDPEIDNLRITVIKPDGTVIYDSNADIGNMDNHGERPEVKEALETGEGYSIRLSYTKKESAFYYAKRMENGDILRVAKASGSIYNLLLVLLPRAAVIFIMLVVLSSLFARYMTQKFMAPIEAMARDMDGMENVETYEELTPLLDKINNQHRDIVESAQMRQEFTANVSHELKTPLTAISGYSELIETGLAGEDDVRRFAGEIRKSSNRLLTLINDSIRLSELDVMENEADIERVDLTKIVETCVDMLQMQAEKHKVTLQIKEMPDTAFVKADKRMMEELSYNLCDNAIRYNRPGGLVTVRVWQEPEKTILEVQDNGIGISRKHQKRIFERFYRVDKSRSKSTGGTGLGLAIVKHIVEQHQAELQVESEEGKGTTMRVVFG